MQTKVNHILTVDANYTFTEYVYILVAATYIHIYFEILPLDCIFEEKKQCYTHEINKLLFSFYTTCPCDDVSSKYLFPNINVRFFLKKHVVGLFMLLLFTVGSIVINFLLQVLMK